MTPTTGQTAAGVEAVRAGTPAASAAAADATIGARAEVKTATATAGAATILAGFTLFLAGVRELHRAWLVKNLAGRGPEDEVQAAIAQEMTFESAFAQASAERLARAMPAALSIVDPAERAAKVKALLDAEKRYTDQRAQAMAERVILAMQRARVRATSPAGAYWKLGVAKNHTAGCLKMGGKPWPWEVLARVHPPRHPGCVSTLHTIDEAIARGWMTAGDMPSRREALRRSAGVMQGEG